MSRKLLILDYGGVYSFEYVASNFETIMQQSFGVVPNQSQKDAIAIESRLFSANKIVTSEYIERVGYILKCNHLPTEQQFQDATLAVTNPPSPAMVKLVSDVRRSGTPVSLLSDMYMFEVAETRNSGRYDGFDFVSFSAEAGMTKADPQFFERTLEQFSVAPDDALFVDDTQSHTQVAASLGINVLWADRRHYVGVDELVRDISGRMRV